MDALMRFYRIECRAV